jgi:hypothetical protein
MSRREKRTWAIVMAIVLTLACTLLWWFAHKNVKSEPSGNAHFVDNTQEGRRLL